MNVISIPPIIMAGVIVYIGIFHLTIYFQRLNRRGDLAFALICFGMALYDIFCAGLYNVTSVTDGANWQRAQVFALMLTGVLFLWFIADYTSQGSRIWIYSFTGFFLVTSLILLIERSGLAFLIDHPLIKKISLPLGLEITYYEAAPGPFTGFLSVAGLLLLVYTLRLIVKYYRSGNRKKQSRCFGPFSFYLWACGMILR